MRKWESDSVPIIQQDLSQEETIVQIAFALDALEAVATNIFQHVQTNLERGRKRLQDLQERCNQAQAKVQKITGINKSVKIVSSNKFPSRDEENYKFIYKPAEIIQKDSDIQCKPLSSDKMLMKEKLKFYHVKHSTEPLYKNPSKFPTEGLGTVPKCLKSVSELILFNTTQNVYKKYKMFDPLSVQKQNVLQELDRERLLVEPAPSSIDSHLDWLNYRHDHDFFYSPTTLDVPELEVPLDLPDLPGIAGDLQFCMDTPQVENIQISSLPEEEEIVDGIVVDLPKLDDVVLNESAKSCPPPPPPPPPPVASPPPPPPPPPPIAASTEPITTNKEPGVHSNTGSTELRANLMEAIRKAGGITTLKKVSKKEEENNVQEKKSAPNSFMHELHDKLSWRRKGISGKFDSGGSIMDKIGELIPPPPTKPPEPDTDEEWED